MGILSLLLYFTDELKAMKLKRIPAKKLRELDAVAMAASSHKYESPFSFLL